MSSEGDILAEKLLKGELRIESANLAIANPCSKTHSHLHPDQMHITFTDSGKGTCTLPDEQLLLEAGVVHTIFPNEVHQYKADPADPYRTYFLHLWCFGAAPSLPRMIKTTSGEQRGMFKKIFHELFHIYHFYEGRTKQHRLTALLFTLFAEMLENFPDHAAAADAKRVPDTAFFIDVLSLVQSPPFEFPGIDHLAALKNMSRRNFTRVFRRETGMSVADYFSQARMKYAKYLMEYSEFPLKEIANRCGYSNSQNFLRAYKKHFAK